VVVGKADERHEYCWGVTLRFRVYSGGGHCDDRDLLHRTEQSPSPNLCCQDRLGSRRSGECLPGRRERSSEASF
jgi:hypothetical protein